MGKFNSSTTRVAPVFDQLYAADETGISWLPTLLAIGRHEVVATPSGEPPQLVENHGAKWGKHELSLPAPLGLLEHLIHTVSKEQVEASGDVIEVLASRRRLAAREPEAIAKALEALRGGSRGRKWYVLEGASRPDATLEMADTVLVVEGKRTERSCTSVTKWMGARSQLLRHMDAATDHFPTKRVIGLLLVEGDGGADAVEPSEHWKREAAAQSVPAMLATSLPHRSADERQLIASGLLGVATWQYVCATHRLPWPPAPDAL